MIQDWILFISCMIFLIVIFLGIIYAEWYLPKEEKKRAEESKKVPQEYADKTS